MAHPPLRDVDKLKRLVRYLIEAREVVYKFGLIYEEPKTVEVLADSKWAACLDTRRSTSGGAVVVAGSAIKTYSSTQGSTAASVGEAEYYTALKGAAEGLGVQALARDLGVEMSVKLWSDSTSARGIACRKGLSGRTRHVETKFLWLQEAISSQRIHWGKVHTSVNPADLMTKINSRSEACRLVQLVGGDMIVGKSAPSNDGCVCVCVVGSITTACRYVRAISVESK